MKRYNKIPAELVVASRDVLEVRPRLPTLPPADQDETAEHDEDERWDNSPCTD